MVKNKIFIVFTFMIALLLIMSCDFSLHLIGFPGTPKEVKGDYVYSFPMDSHETNDTYTSTNVAFLDYNSGAYGYTIHSFDDIDWFRFAIVSTNTNIEVLLRYENNLIEPYGSSLPANITGVYENGVNFVNYNNFGIDKSDGNINMIWHYTLQAGTYYIKVQSLNHRYEYDIELYKE